MASGKISVANLALISTALEGIPLIHKQSRQLRGKVSNGIHTIEIIVIAE
jgi:hypothetical protein